MILPSRCEPRQRRTQHSAGPFAPPNPAGRLPELKQKAIHAPGHTRGHLSLYRRSDGVVITGDPSGDRGLELAGRRLDRQAGGVRPAALEHLGLGCGAAIDRRPGRLGAASPGHRPWWVRVGDATNAARPGRRATHSCRWRQGLFSGMDYSARTRYRRPPALPAAAEAAWSVHDQSRNRAKAVPAALGSPAELACRAERSSAVFRSQR
jgi:hypothetical protein